MCTFQWCSNTVSQPYESIRFGDKVLHSDSYQQDWSAKQFNAVCLLFSSHTLRLPAASCGYTVQVSCLHSVAEKGASVLNFNLKSAQFYLFFFMKQPFKWFEKWKWYVSEKPFFFLFLSHEAYSYAKRRSPWCLRTISFWKLFWSLCWRWYIWLGWGRNCSSQSRRKM